MNLRDCPVAIDLESIERWLKILAYVAAASWAIFHFYMSRVYRPRVDPTIQLSLYRTFAPQVLTISIRIKNVGLGKIDLRGPGKAITVYVFDEKEDDDWRQMGVYDILHRHEWIEPGETIQDALVVPGDFTDVAVVRAELDFSAGGTAWNATAVVTSVADLST